MTQFGCDYLSGCHPAILDALVATNLEQTAGYGLDPYCEAARARIRAAVGSEAADVHFLVGGTQTNATVIASILRPWQGVIAADSGHIAVHETGAIEAGGHKVLTLPAADGKLDAAQLRDFMERYWLASGVKEHIVQPGMVYLSQPTELGTVYSKAELAALAQTCRHYRLPLFVDGARLGYALAPEVSDLTLPDLAALCDVFYIGGTKCGALFGEAVVIMNDAYKANFRAMMKQGGGLLAKGRLLGIQFDALFRDGLYQRSAPPQSPTRARSARRLRQKAWHSTAPPPPTSNSPFWRVRRRNTSSANLAFPTGKRTASRRCCATAPVGRPRRRMCARWWTRQGGCDACMKNPGANHDPCLLEHSRHRFLADWLCRLRQTPRRFFLGG